MSTTLPTQQILEILPTQEIPESCPHCNEYPGNEQSNCPLASHCPYCGCRTDLRGDHLSNCPLAGPCPHCCRRIDLGSEHFSVCSLATYCPECGCQTGVQTVRHRRGCRLAYPCHHCNQPINMPGIEHLLGCQHHPQSTIQTNECQYLWYCIYCIGDSEVPPLEDV